jgi:hypothetical protein
MRILRNDQWQKIRDFLEAKNGDQTEQALGRSRGGFNTRIHVSVDGLGKPLRFILKPGQAGDSL